MKQIRRDADGGKKDLLKHERRRECLVFMELLK